MRSSLLSLVLLLALGCAGAPAPSLPPADLVFFGDALLTVDAATAGATALAVSGESIVAVGDRASVAGRVGPNTRVVDLGDHALVPGFIDAHGHLSLVMATLDFVNVSSPPVGPAKTVEDVIQLMAARIAEREIPAGQWVIGYGYDDSLLAEGRHPNRDDLDLASTDHPIALVHVSAHLAALNSAALAASSINAKSEDPPGGVIRRRSGSAEPNGVLEETASGAVVFPRLAEAAADFATSLRKAIAYHARFGITTIQDGAASPPAIAGMQALAAQSPFAVDVVSFPHVGTMTIDSPLEGIGFSADYTNHFRVGGVKFVLDGSPQGRTAWLTQPYTEGPPGAPADYVAYPSSDPAQYRALVARLIQAGIPVLAHANGDAAIDLMIEGVDVALKSGAKDHRSVTIHAQLAREDQIDRMAELGIVPSYFAAHPFFWGDWHRRSFGEERASQISPMRSTLNKGVPFTIHNDAPVVPPDMMRLLHIAVNRKTRSGHVLGPEQRLTVEQALHAVTLGAAYAYFEEDRKGSLSVGKQADLVVLSRDPRTTPEELHSVEVVETISRGRSVFVAP